MREYSAACYGFKESHTLITTGFAQEFLPAQGPGAEARGRQHDHPLGPRRALPLARVDTDLRGERARQEHVREGLQPGQCRVRGLLRPPQERVLLLQGLVGRHARGVHGEARRPPPLLLRGQDKEVPGLAQPEAITAASLDTSHRRSKKSSAPPSRYWCRKWHQCIRSRP